MNTTVSSVASSVCAMPKSLQTQAAGGSPAATPRANPDQITSSPAPAAPLLTIGAAALAQLIPGTVEAEGALGVATALKIGVDAALRNPVISAVTGAATLAAGSYIKSLAHDALAAAPGVKPFADVAAGLDSSLRAGLGIPQSSDR